VIAAPRGQVGGALCLGHAGQKCSRSRELQALLGCDGIRSGSRRGSAS
jgi:hypothetical protein